MHAILAQKIEINGRKIYCKVLSPTPLLNSTKPFLLCIPGGPGFGHTITELTVKNLEKKAQVQNSEMPNVILYDPLGCENSDPAQDIAVEYSMNNFTEIASLVVEAVKDRLCPQQPMDLRVYGGSFGSMTAMDLPMHRPQWLEEESDIRIKQIISVVGPNGEGDYEYSRNYLEENFRQHPQYEVLKMALNKILEGKILNQDDYIKNIVFNLAPLYSDEHEKLLNSFQGKIIKKFYRQIIPLLKAVNVVCKKLSVNSSSLEDILNGLTGCSLGVLNQFFRTHHSGFNLLANISQHLDLYSKVPICLISCTRDHMVNYQTAVQINQLLPNTSAAIIFNEKHQVNKGPAKELYDTLFLSALQGHITVSLLNNPKINQYHVSDNFQRMLAAVSQPHALSPSSTGKTFSALHITDTSLKQKQTVEAGVIPEAQEVPQYQSKEIMPAFMIRR